MKYGPSDISLAVSCGLLPLLFKLTLGNSKMTYLMPVPKRCLTLAQFDLILQCSSSNLLNLITLTSGYMPFLSFIYLHPKTKSLQNFYAGFWWEWVLVYAMPFPTCTNESVKFQNVFENKFLQFSIKVLPWNMFTCICLLLNISGQYIIANISHVPINVYILNIY